MRTKISTATPEQWAKIDAIKHYWLGRQTEEVHHNRVRSVVSRMWASMGEHPPVVLVAPSPLSALLWAQTFGTVASQKSKLYDQLYDQLNDKLYAQLYAQLSDQLSGQLYAQLSAQLYAQLNDQINDQINTQLDNQLRAQLDDQLYDQLYDQLGDQLNDQLHDQLRSQPRYWSIWWQAWAGWYEGAKTLGVRFDEDKYDLFREWCICCPFVVPYKGLVIVAANPTAIEWDDGQLHCVDGPAVEYADGWKLWSVEGVRVTEQIVMRPETQTIKEIEAEKNEEGKRIRIDRFGWMRYLEETDSKVVELNKNATENTVEILANTPQGQRLITFCPSTGRRYSLSIPGERVTTCAQAQQRIWGDRNIKIVGRT